MIKIKNIILFSYLILSGFIYSFFIFPFQKPDEFDHFKRMVSVANYDIFCRKKNILIRKDLVNLFNDKDINKLPYNYNQKINFEKLLLYPVDQIKINFNIKSGCRFKNWFGYIFNSFFYRILTPLSLNPYLIIVLTRFFTYLLIVVILYFSINNIKNLIFKYSMIFALFLPMTLHQLSAISYDTGHLFFGFLFLINLFSLINKKYLEYLDIFKLIFYYLGLIFSKPLYEFLSFLFLTLKRNQFSKLKISRNTFLLFILSIFIFKLINIFDIGIPLGKNSYNEQFFFLLSNPFIILIVFLKTFLSSIDFYLKSLIGIFGWLDFELNFLVYGLIFLLFGVFLEKYYKKFSLSAYNFIVLFITALFNTLIIFLAEYIFWTTPKSFVIHGVQGRYFILFVPIFLLLTLRLYGKYKYVFYFFILILIILFNLIAIYRRYYLFTF